MIQAGDSASRTAKEGELLGDSPEPYTLPAEIHYPQHFHRRGALAAAREADAENPERRSSYSQFYIVTGAIFTDDGLDQMQERLQANVMKPATIRFFFIIIVWFNGFL